MNKEHMIEKKYYVMREERQLKRMNYELGIIET